MEKTFSNRNSVSTARILRGYNSAKVANDDVAVKENWMHHNHEATKAINANELTSLSALISYVAYITGSSEFSVERRLADRFNIPNVKCLPTEKFDDALRHLVEQVPSGNGLVV